MSGVPTAIICLSPYAGGMEIDALKLAKLLNRDVPVTVIARQDTFIHQQCLSHESYRELSCETLRFGGSLSVSLIVGARRMLQTLGIRNVIFFGASELKSLYFAFLGQKINLIIRHGTTKRRPKKGWFHQLVYSGVNTHVAICEHLSDNVKRIVPIGSRNGLKVIYPSLNTLPETPIDLQERPHTPIRLLHVGRIAPGKGQKRAIEACAALHEAGIDFVLQLAGRADEAYKKTFTEYLDGVAYRDNIVLLGHRDDLASLYASADVFLFPSDGEGLSNAFIEALSFGLAAISYANTSFPELRRMGFTFDLVENQNLSLLRERLVHVARHYDDKTALRDNAKLALSLFGADRERDEWLTLLRESNDR